MKIIEPYDEIRQTIDVCLSRYKQYPNLIREMEIVIFCIYKSLNDYSIGCCWRVIGAKKSCTVYYVLNIELCHNFTEQMYKYVQLELERKIKEALVENRKKELEKDFV